MIDLLKQVKQLFNVADFYDLLEISKNCNQSEIRKAYFQRCVQVHPDKTHDVKEKKLQEDRFHVLTLVYQVLMDEETRRDYNSIIDRHTTVIDQDSNFREEIMLKDCEESENNFTFECRCSGLFVLNKRDFYSRRCDMPSIAYIIDCDTCSNSIKLIAD